MGWAAPGEAAIQTYVFTGTVTFAGGLAPTITSGQAVSGFFKVDTTTPADGSSDATVAGYAAITAFSITVGGYTATSTGGRIVIVNDTNDVLGIQGSNPVTGAAINGLVPASPRIELSDSTGAVFGPAAAGLPLPFVFGAFDGTDGVVEFSGNDPGQAAFTLSGLRLVEVTVPEPVALALFGLGLAGLAGLRAGRRAVVRA
ncbi:hypothetical protein DFH01_16315 [Falsiroseomonas bella]|uniref:Ice-binding protein C-terminal domain-containing protein n=1 Tax=Falsiroseomonas bella TaxID=2184016 RepID=A0A317FCU5_9PROT|nr:hypothetical protein DFH01_16315 [Falsiroseomonas bella]